MIKKIFVLLSVLVFTIIALPGLMYLYGMYLIDNMPVKPVKMIDRKDMLVVWKEYQGQGNPGIQAINPWHYYWLLFCNVKAKSIVDIKKCKSSIIGLQHAAKLSQLYIRKNNRFNGVLKWHIAIAALSVWFSRNWNIDVILTMLYNESRPYSGKVM